jgi:hypothetical protein
MVEPVWMAKVWVKDCSDLNVRPDFWLKDLIALRCDSGGENRPESRQQFFAFASINY